jgi:hypothetical protein
VKRGRPATLRAFGSSMHPIIESGQHVRLEPVDTDRLELGDVVMVEVNGSTMLHLISAIDLVDRRVEISGTGGEVNGWTSFERVFAICTEIGGRPVPGASVKTRRPAR